MFLIFEGHDEAQNRGQNKRYRTIYLTRRKAIFFILGKFPNKQKECKKARNNVMYLSCYVILYSDPKQICFGCENFSILIFVRACILVQSKYCDNKIFMTGKRFVTQILAFF